MDDFSENLQTAIEPPNPHPLFGKIYCSFLAKRLTFRFFKYLILLKYKLHFVKKSAVEIFRSKITRSPFFRDSLKNHPILRMRLWSSLAQDQGFAKC